MGFDAKIIADSMSPDGVRLTTMQVTYPRIIHAEVMTHRAFSRNAASSRAIPVEKMIKMVQEEPYVPSEWGANQRGMQAGEPVAPEFAAQARTEWLHARDNAVFAAKRLVDLNIHKQWANRLLEPFLWYTAVITATEWQNFFHLRVHPAAHPDIRTIAAMMQDLHETVTPEKLEHDDWHLPYIREDDWELFDQSKLDVHQLVKISCARCARLSYLTQDGKCDVSKDLELYDRLLEPGHMSPFEHAARPMRVFPKADKWVGVHGHVHETFCGNFRGWVQHRKEISGEADILAHRQE